jgi:phosphonate transport system substrate-binding protein
MLTEATRKLWTSIIISKIQQASRQHHTMNEAQHGYKRNRGTDSASLIFINLVESAEASQDTSHRTSYDMSRAFDAVSKNLQSDKALISKLQSALEGLGEALKSKPELLPPHYTGFVSKDNSFYKPIRDAALATGKLQAK